MTVETTGCDNLSRNIYMIWGSPRTKEREREPFFNTFEKAALIFSGTQLKNVQIHNFETIEKSINLSFGSNSGMNTQMLLCKMKIDQESEALVPDFFIQNRHLVLYT